MSFTTRGASAAEQGGLEARKTHMRSEQKACSAFTRIGRLILPPTVDVIEHIGVPACALELVELEPMYLRAAGDAHRPLAKEFNFFAAGNPGHRG
ncbi:hypothetical protein MYSI104531_26345 [Mycobacterium simiae]